LKNLGLLNVTVYVKHRTRLNHASLERRGRKERRRLRSSREKLSTCVAWTT